MDIRRLEHLMAVAETGRFVAAAEKVHLSQAAFSRSIQTLEEEFGIKLFDRGRRGASPTQAGLAVIERVRHLVIDMRRLKYDIDLIKTGDAGMLRIGTGPVPAQTVVPEALIEMRRNRPGLQISVTVGSADQLLEQLEADELDVVVADPRFITRSTAISASPIGQHQVALYCRMDHPLSTKQRVSMTDVCTYGVITGKGGRTSFQAIATTMGWADGLELPRIMESDDLGILGRIVTMTDTLALIPDQQKSSPYGQLLRRLNWPELPSLPIYMHAISLKGRTQSPSVKEFVGLAEHMAKSWEQSVAT